MEDEGERLGIVWYSIVGAGILSLYLFAFAVIWVSIHSVSS
jgi:hypothetical protein